MRKPRSLLRRWLIGLSLLYLAVAAILIVAHVTLLLAGYLILGGVVVLVSILLERRGYRPRLDRAHGRWERTGERFVDPASGKLLEVRYNPQTGERDYVEAETRR